MEEDLAKRIASHPRYQELKAKRTSLGWWLTLAGMLAYYGFILLVAGDKEFVSRKIGENTTLAIPIGVGVIVFAWLLTALYVAWTNRSYDPEVERLKNELRH